MKPGLSAGCLRAGKSSSAGWRAGLNARRAVKARRLLGAAARACRFADSWLSFGRNPRVTWAGDIPRDAVTSEAPANLANLGLVAAARPADVPPVVGRSVFGHDESGPGARSLEIAAALR